MIHNTHKSENLKRLYIIVAVVVALLLTAVGIIHMTAYAAKPAPLPAAEDISSPRQVDKPILSSLASENEKGEAIFSLSVSNFIDRYNREYAHTHDIEYLTYINEADWYTYEELCPTFGYNSYRYMFTEDKSVWPMPTLSIYSPDDSSLYELRVTFDDHGYQEKLYYKFKDMSCCLLGLSCPSLSDEDIGKLFDELYSLAYDNFWGNNYSFDDPDRPALTKLYRFEDVGLYSFYGAGYIEICVFPFTDIASGKFTPEGTEIIPLEKYAQSSGGNQ